MATLLKRTLYVFALLILTIFIPPARVTRDIRLPVIYDFEYKLEVIYPYGSFLKKIQPILMKNWFDCSFIIFYLRVCI